MLQSQTVLVNENESPNNQQSTYNNYFELKNSIKVKRPASNFQRVVDELKPHKQAARDSLYTIFFKVNDAI